MGELVGYMCGVGVQQHDGADGQRPTDELQGLAEHARASVARKRPCE